MAVIWTKNINFDHTKRGKETPAHVKKGGKDQIAGYVNPDGAEIGRRGVEGLPPGPSLAEIPAFCLGAIETRPELELLVSG